MISCIFSLQLFRIMSRTLLFCTDIIMIKRLQFNGDSTYLYLAKPILQLMVADPNETKFIFSVKNKTLYISKIEQTTDEKQLKNALVKKAQKNGSGFCIYIPKPVLEIIDIAPEIDMVDVTIEEQTIILKKAQ